MSTGVPGPNLGLTGGWTDRDNGWGAAMNASQLLLDTLVMCAVESMGLNAPPTGVFGERFVVGSAPTGAWAGKAGQIAIFYASAWVFYAPTIGWRIYNEADGFLYLFSNANVWVGEMSTGYTPFTAQTAWATATSYVAGPPASYVSQGGSSYVCLVSHTAGTFATDLAAGKWGLVAQRGSDGSNALSVLSNWTTATAYTATLPASFVTINNSTYACAVSHTSGTFATDLAAGKWLPVALAGAANSIYDLSIFVVGQANTTQLIYSVVQARGTQMSADLAGSLGYCRTNPAAAAAFDLKKTSGGVTATCATVSISTSGVFTFTTVGHATVTFAAGDRIDIFAPAVADITLADIAFTLALIRL